jgi:hypothetical protein
VILPRALTSVRAGLDLSVEPVVIGGVPARLHWRATPGAAWKSAPLTRRRGWVGQATVPAVDVREPFLEVAVSLDGEPDGFAWGPVAVTVRPPVDLHTQAPGAIAAAEQGAPEFTVRAAMGERVPVELAWDPVAGVDHYRVTRDGQVVGETAVGFFPDVHGPGPVTYLVEAVRDGRVIARSRPCAVDVTLPSYSVETELRAVSNRAGVILEWSSTESSLTRSYRIEARCVSADDPWTVVHEALDAGAAGMRLFHEPTRPGVWSYRVTPLDVAGRTAAAAEARVDFGAAAPLPEPWSLPLDELPAGGEVHGAVSLGPEGAVLQGGHVLIPHADWMNLGTGMTLAFEFRWDDPVEMPVLLCHGAWQVSGWFVQILGGRLVVRMPGGDAQGPVIQPGTWYSVRFVYDGVGVRLQVNGEWLPQPAQSIEPSAARLPLTIGNYSQVDVRYSFRGRIRNLRVHNDVVIE